MGGVATVGGCRRGMPSGDGARDATGWARRGRYAGTFVVAAGATARRRRGRAKGRFVGGAASGRRLQWTMAELPRPPSGNTTRRARPRRASDRARGRGDVELDAALGEVDRLLDVPLAALMDTEAARDEAERLTREAAAVPSMSRLRAVVSFVGAGRPATPAGNLRAADAAALARRLGTGEEIPEPVRSLDDLPDTAHAFGWAVATGLLDHRASKVVAGPRARDLEGDPLSAWLAAATTLLENGLVGGFRRGWRKRYLEVLDLAAPGLVVSLASSDDPVPLSVIEQQGWEIVVANAGVDDDERRHVVRLVRAMVAQLVELGVVTCHEDDVTLTGLGSVLAVGVALALDDDEDDPGPTRRQGAGPRPRRKR